MKTKSVYYLMYFIFAAMLISSCKDDSDDPEVLVGNWIDKSAFGGVARSEAVSFVIGDKSYICGGLSNEWLKDLWEYDLNTDTWTEKEPLPDKYANNDTLFGRTKAVAFVIGTKAYVTTGTYDGENFMKDTWEYDQATDKWTQKKDFGGTARYDAVAFSLNGKGYVGTGFDGNYTKDFCVYDPSADTWTLLTPAIGGSKRTGASAFVINGEAYVCGGMDNDSYVTDFHKYNAAENKWTELRPIRDFSDESYDDDYGTVVDLKIARQKPITLNVGSKVYLTLGYTNNGVNATTWEYDPANDLWLTKTPFEGKARLGAVSFTLNNRGFILTGRSSSSRFDDCWEFKPDDEYNEKD